MTYTVGEMAKLLGVTPSALRYYDKEGLLPFVERSSGGMRIFQEKDYEWLQIIQCLKDTGMSLRDIRRYIDLAMEGDATIQARLEIFQSRREAVREQMRQLQETLDLLDFKCWYYEQAIQDGNENRIKAMIPDNLPDGIREAYQNAHKNDRPR